MSASTRLVRSFGVLLLAAMLANCGGDGGGPVTPPPPPPPPTVASVSLNQTTASLQPGQTVQLTATPRDASGNSLAGYTAMWSSNANAVATVVNGLVTAVATGTAEISAAIDGKSAKATVTVSVPAGGIGPSGGTAVSSNGLAKVEVPAGALSTPRQITVAPVANPQADARLVVNTAYEFGPTGTTFAAPVTLSIQYDPTSVAGRNPSRFMVHKLVAGGWSLVAGGSVDVTTRTVIAPTSSFSTYAILEVPVPVATVAVSAPSASVQIGGTLQLGVVVKDAQGNVLTGRAVAWTAVPAASATVSAAGVLTPLVQGPVTIRAVSEGIAGELGLTILPAGFALQQLSLSRYACGVTPGGQGYCWGENLSGTVGDGTNIDRLRPTLVSGGKSWRSIQVNSADDGSFTCGLTTDGAAWCWGGNSSGQFGDGTDIGSYTPIKTLGGLAFGQLAVGENWVCGLTASGEAWCWGDNLRGALGVGDQFDRRVPVRVSGGHLFSQISASADHVCGVTATGEAWCWGSNIDGQVGDGTEGNRRLTPVKVASAPAFTAVSAGAKSSCGVTVGGEVWCWGSNTSGQLGDGTVIDRLLPNRIVGGGTYVEVMVGSFHACARTGGGEIWCWGENGAGALGDGSTVSRLQPVKVAGGLLFTKLAVGIGFAGNSCGITALGEAWCWGANGQGQLGDGTSGNQRLAPVKALGPP